MPNPSGLLVYSPPPATTLISPPNSTKLNFLSPPPTATTLRYSSSVKSSSSPSSNSITEFDLYDLLGIDSCSDQSQIKMAYRSLQKRCHPDIAGAAGHDMAIILNDAYSILSNPFLRSAYDKEQSKFTEFKGYTGKPLYSTWMGSDKEDRAVFVDEVKCVGCLKCALFAKNTFAIESNYGRARVVAQWADPEDKIFDAIQTCPVDCISLVERSDLAALEFLMSKQPRGNVRIGAGNTVGARVSNIFVDVKKFQNRFDQVKNNDSETDSRESDLLREARMSAIHAIRSITNLWYWQTPKGGEATQAPKQNMILLAENSTQPGTQKLRDAAAARQEAAMGSIMSKPEMPSSDTATHRDEYWTPKTFIPPPSSTDNAKNNSKTVQESKSGTSTSTNVRGNLKRGKAEEMKPYNLFFPLGLAVVASAVIRVQVQRGLVGGNSSLVREHTAGYLAAEIVNSSWLQTILAGVTWYVIGMLIVELVDILRNRK